MSEDCHDSNNLDAIRSTLEDIDYWDHYAQELDDWLDYQEEQDMEAEAAYYSDPRWKEVLGE